ncbi:alpha/beta fold hydrolase [Caulobacter sp.]|uniref:alpha/beta fold hydrolase n=1 Tax=Caulobacter sp. TaxID=78 RepID=UPI001608F4A9
MRHPSRVALVAALLAPAVALAQAGPIAGDWSGVLDAPNGKLPLIFHIKPDGSATLDSLAQKAMGLPARAAFADGKARLELAIAAASFEGTLSADGKTLQGQWRQGGGAAPLVMTRTAATAIDIQRPQTPKPPFPYRAQDVTYANPASGLGLAGTLTLPPGQGPFPAVLLITGSGAQDRDETIFGHKPFLLLADALTRRGVAVLRVDDRGMGGSAPPAADATLDDQLSDVAASLAWLRGRPEIDKARVGLLGHSEGGTLAIRAAAADPKVAFVTLLAAPGVRGGDLIVSQVGTILGASGAPASAIGTAQTLQRQLMDVVASPQDEASAAAALNAIFDRNGAPAGALQRQTQLKPLLSPHYRSFVRFDPRADLGRIRVPVLAVGGGKDTQVPAAQNLEAIRAGLPVGADLTTTQFPGLNHLFQTAGTGLIGEYAAIEETMAPAALTAIVDWTVAHAGVGR